MTMVPFPPFPDYPKRQIRLNSFHSLPTRIHFHIKHHLHEWNRAHIYIYPRHSQNDKKVKTETDYLTQQIHDVWFISECVRSIINFHPRSQDVDFNLLEMFFSFQCIKYDENRWPNTKLFKKRDVIALKDNMSILHNCVLQKMKFFTTIQRDGICCRPSKHF